MTHKGTDDITLPVAANKTTIYEPRGPHYSWIATTNSTIIDQPENLERDEARAKMIALALNSHQDLLEMCEALMAQIKNYSSTYPLRGDAEALIARIKREE